MAIEYTWSIADLERRVSDGFVTTAHWRVYAVDGEYTAGSYGSCGFGEGEPEVPYEDLTPEAVLSWIWENGVDKDETEAQLATQIDALKNPVQESGTPW